MKKNYLLLIVIFFISINALSIAPFVEPYAGVGYLSSKQETLIADFESSGYEYGIGVRAGLSHAMFFAGVDLAHFLGNYKVKKVGGQTVENLFDLLGIKNETNSTTRLLTGLTAGIKFSKFPVRLLAGFNLINHYKLKAKDTPDVNHKGSSVKLGVGYMVAPMLSINAEYIMNAFKKPKSDDRAIFLSVSAPISLSSL